MTTQAQRRLTGWAIKARRQFQRMSRPDLATLLEEKLGERFTAGMVNHLENGTKAPTVEIVAALSEIQGMPLEWYFKGSSGDVDVSAFNKPWMHMPSDLHFYATASGL